MPNSEITKLKISMQEIKDEIKFMGEKIESLRELILHLTNKQLQDTIKLYDEMKEANKESEKKFSPMAAWTIWKWVGGIVGGILLSGAVYVIFSHNIFK